MEEVPEPTSRYLLWDGSVEVLCFGAAAGNWALRGQTPEEADAYNPGIVARLRQLSRRFGFGRLHLPSPYEFNACLADPDDFSRRWECGALVRGARVEGSTMQKIGEGVGIASSDCPTIIARNAASLLAVSAHAGRESLYDRAALFGDASPRRHESVVDAIVEKLAHDNLSIRHLQVFVACGIRSDAFSHPTSDARNARLIDHLHGRWGEGVASEDGEGRIDLHEVIRRQFRSKGVFDAQCAEDGSDTCVETTPASGYRWHSHRRDRNGKRNFVLAIRRK